MQAKLDRDKLDQFYKNLENEESKEQSDEYVIENIKKEIITLENQKKKGILVRSRQMYFEDDIENIEIFKLAEEKRGDKKEITKVLDKDGNTCNTQESVMEEVKRFYSELYKTQNIDKEKMKTYLRGLNLKKLTEEDWDLLSTYIGKEECYKLIKDFQNNKAPGIDGLGKEFYLRFWNIIGEDLVEVLNNVYLYRELTDTMRTGIITLQYKNKGDYRDLKQWRPISLLCFDYKIITKFLSKNLAKVLNKLIDPNQTGAGTGKVIFDNLYSIDSILEYMDLNQIVGLLIAFDQEKAFDRIEHDFIIEVLRTMNFPSSFIRWIEILYNNIESKIQVNGRLTDSVDITRSIRQGCPLSMSIYALVIETLACSIRDNDNIKGISIPNSNINSKLFQHADDCTIVTTNTADYDFLISEFNNFGEVSGAKVNENKTEVLKIGNIDLERYEQIKQQTKKKVRILGVWFGQDKVKTNWEPILAKIKREYEKWKDRYLNFKEKVIIINTYFISKILYVARIVPPTEKYIKAINKYIYSFVWNSNFEFLQRNTLRKKYADGGQQVPDIGKKIEALLLHRITQIIKGNRSTWTHIYTYFMGFTTRQILPDLASNTLTHTETVQGIYKYIKFLYLKYKDTVVLKDKNMKELYYQLVEVENFKHKVEQDYIHVDFSAIWNNLVIVKNLFIRDFIYKVIHRCLPTLDKLQKRGIRLENYQCYFCKNHTEDIDHLFIKCKKVMSFRDLVLNIIKNEQNVGNDFKFQVENVILYNINFDIFPYIYAYNRAIWCTRKNITGNFIEQLMTNFYKHEMLFREKNNIYVE